LTNSYGRSWWLVNGGSLSVAVRLCCRVSNTLHACSNHPIFNISIIPNIFSQLIS